MPEIFINGQPIQAEREPDRHAGGARRTASPSRISAGTRSCRSPATAASAPSQVEGVRSWVEIACNMPVSRGPARAHRLASACGRYRKAMMQLVTLNHPVDCGICDKAGECTLQDYHYEYNGAPSISRDAKVRSTKFHALSERIVLDNERCILCSRCVRFTREISKSNALGIMQRGDALAGPRRRGPARSTRDPYSDNVIDLCPVGALLSRPFLLQGARLVSQADALGLPGLRARLHASQIWHRKPEWKLNALDPRAERQRSSASRRSRTRQSTAPGSATRGAISRRSSSVRARAGDAEGHARRSACRDRGRRDALIDSARRPVALVSSWGSNEELARVRSTRLADASPPSSSRIG